MQMTQRITVGGFAVLGLLAIFVIFYRMLNPVPSFKVAPLPKGTRILTTAEVESILAANFNEIRRVQQIPAPVKADFAALTNQPFEMVNPGQTMSTDAVIPGVPNSRLVFAGISDQTAVVIFEHGGLADSFEATVFFHKGDGGMWGAVLFDGQARDISGLRRAVHDGRFHTWGSPM